jgi:anti-anti-sigma factor
MKRGLDRGDAILCTRSGEDELDVLLRPYGLDLTRTRRSGQLQFVAAESLLEADGPARSVERARAAGHDGVRCLATAAELERLFGPPRSLADYERFVDELAASPHVGWLCELDRSAASPAWTSALAAAHALGIRESNVRSRAGGDGSFNLAGDIDIANADVVRAALEAVGAVREPGSGLTVDLRNVSFVDVLGCRSIVEGTEQLRTEGGLVTILAQQRIHHVLELYGLGSMANFTLAPVT